MYLFYLFIFFSPSFGLCHFFLEAALLMLTASLSIPLSLSMLNKTSERTRLVRGYDDLTNHDSTAYIAQHVHITRTLITPNAYGEFSCALRFMLLLLLSETLLYDFLRALYVSMSAR